jgi:SM-20-related protein
MKPWVKPLPGALLEQQKPFYAGSTSTGATIRRSIGDPDLNARYTASRMAGPPGQGPIPPGPPHTSSVAVLAEPELLRADCVTFDEFLSPAEMSAVLQYALDQESAFVISEVTKPESTNGIIAYEQRRSRVLMDLGKHHKLFADRIRVCWPRVLAKLGREFSELSEMEAQITASNDGDYFHCHSDNGCRENVTREITFVYFFHREPNQFQGGELRIYDSRRENDQYLATEKYRSIVPQQNQIVFFPSALIHEITPVECSSRVFADSRFTVNGWLHR